MQTSRTVTVSGLVFLLGILLAGSSVRAGIRSSLTHTPDDKHIHQVFGRHTIRQQIIAPTGTIGAFSFFIDPTRLPPAETPLLLHVRVAGTDSNIRTVSTTLGAVRQDNALMFPFELLKRTKGQRYEFELEAATIKQSQALRVRYQSDSEKYPVGSSSSGEETKQGNLGFVLWEQPSILVIIGRWFIYPDNVLIWPALLAMIAGIAGLFYLRSTTAPDPWWQAQWKAVSVRHLLYWSLALLIIPFVVYWPALQQFFFHDDIALLARSIQFVQEGHWWELLTARPYIEVDEHSHYIIPFWRPLSAGLYPLLTTYVFGLSSPLAFALHVLIVGITGVLLFVLATLLTKNNLLSFLMVVLWLTHSSKIGALYWWSSSQDLLASLCIGIAIVLYARWRAYPDQRWLIITATVSSAFGMLSKEHAIFIPLLIWLCCELPALWQRASKTALYHSVVRISPFILIAGVYLALRTLAFSDPQLPDLFHNETTYTVTTSVDKVAQNIVTYGAWSAEQWLWPLDLWPSANSLLGNWMWEIKIQPPLYPAVIFFGVWLLAITAFWRTRRARLLLILGAVWWLVFLGPTLLLSHEWNARWLYMSIFGVSLAVGGVALQLPSRLRNAACLVAIVALLIYGPWQARDPEQTRFYREQAAYSRVAYEQFIAQRGRLTPESNVFLVGVVPHQTTSVNAYLFRLGGLPAYTPLTRIPEMPTDIGDHDIVINMTNYDALYPHYDQD